MKHENILSLSCIKTKC